ncbi:hypothetical protein Hanom_Chr14g01262591 [Helianthus anomalus]
MFEAVFTISGDKFSNFPPPRDAIVSGSVCDKKFWNDLLKRYNNNNNNKYLDFPK